MSEQMITSAVLVPVIQNCTDTNYLENFNENSDLDEPNPITLSYTEGYFIISIFSAPDYDFSYKLLSQESLNNLFLQAKAILEKQGVKYFEQDCAKYIVGLQSYYTGVDDYFSELEPNDVELATLKF